MALIKKKELKAMNEQTMQSKIQDLRHEQLKANMQKGSQNPVRIRQIRRTIAQILTRVNELKRTAAQPAQKKKADDSGKKTEKKAEKDKGKAKQEKK